MTFALVLIYCLGFFLVLLCVGAVNRGVESPAIRRRYARAGLLLAALWPLALAWIIVMAGRVALLRKAQRA